jgi:hypothetical protein
MMKSEDETDPLVGKGLLSLFTIEDTFEGTDNDWSVENKKAFGIISEKLHRSSFVFQYVLERQRRNRGRLSIASYVLSGSGGIGSTVTSILNASSKAAAISAVSIAGAILTAAGIAIAWASKKYFGYDELIEKCTAHTAKIDSLYFEFGRISTTPPSRRENAVAFLNRVTLSHESLVREEPVIAESLLLEASKAFDDKKIMINV